MKATGSYSVAIDATQEAEQQANSIINAAYEGYVGHLVVSQCLLMPHVRHVYVLLPFVMPPIRYARLGLHIVVSLKGRTTDIWSIGCGIACATTMRCAGFRLSFGIIILLYLLTIIK